MWRVCVLCVVCGVSVLCVVSVCGVYGVWCFCVWCVWYVVCLCVVCLFVVCGVSVWCVVGLCGVSVCVVWYVVCLWCVVCLSGSHHTPYSYIYIYIGWYAQLPGAVFLFLMLFHGGASSSYCTEFLLSTLVNICTTCCNSAVYVRFSRVAHYALISSLNIISRFIFVQERATGLF